MADKQADAGQEALAGAIATGESLKRLAERAIEQVADADLHKALDANTNSIAVITRHLAGNMRSRWTNFLTEDGEKSWRQRDGEFVDDNASRDELLANWQSGWQCFFDALQRLAPDDLTRTVHVRGHPQTAAGAILGQLAHYGQHVGQILLIARVLAGDSWTVLTIPRGEGESEKYNRRTWQK
jgi:hypothetical protein